ncbi:hypothetical protein TNCV_3584711 [Trichonephila clavipes]|nr:hypothetical protein TNCV_3584711 [Trichonephila clavipes]
MLLLFRDVTLHQGYQIGDLIALGDKFREKYDITKKPVCFAFILHWIKVAGVLPAFRYVPTGRLFQGSPDQLGNALKDIHCLFVTVEYIQENLFLSSNAF